MSLAVVVITNKLSLPSRFLNQFAFTNSIWVIYEENNPKVEASFSKINFVKASEKLNFSEKRNLGLKSVKEEWVLFVDDDEVVSKELAAEMLEKINEDKFDGFYIQRLDVYYHQVLKWGEVKSQYLLRLAKKTAGSFSRPVHEVWDVKGKVGKLKNVLYHEKSGFVEGFLDRIRRYGELDATALIAEKKSFSFWRLLLLPKAKFFVNYFWRSGFRDGYPGLFLSYLVSIQSLSVRIFQWEKERSF